MRAHRLSKIGAMMVVVAMIAFLLSAYRNTRRQRHLEDAAWFAAKAEEARAVAAVCERNGNLVAAKVLRSQAEECEQQGERERSAW